MADQIVWKRGRVRAPDARYEQAHVVYDPPSLGVRIFDRRDLTVEIGVYQLDGEPVIDKRGSRGKPELGGMVDGAALTIVADCSCNKQTRRVDLGVR